jgi:hypothetical protein
MSAVSFWAAAVFSGGEAIAHSGCSVEPWRPVRAALDPRQRPVANLLRMARRLAWTQQCGDGGLPLIEEDVMARTPIHPGEILGDELEEIGLSAKQLADLIETPPNIKTLKAEEVELRRYRDLNDARASIGEFLEEVYRRRRHSALGYRPPEEFEASLPAAPATLRNPSYEFSKRESTPQPRPEIRRARTFHSSAQFCEAPCGYVPLDWLQSAYV